VSQQFVLNVLMAMAIAAVVVRLINKMTASEFMAFVLIGFWAMMLLWWAQSTQ
jgi:hypothetical protein